MTKKVYKTAQGKAVDMGALLLQNENVRAVGNMGVNARGDVIDSRNRVVDKKSHQIKRQNKRTTNVTRGNLDNTIEEKSTISKTIVPEDTFDDLPDDNEIVRTTLTDTTDLLKGGLAGAIAKAKTVQQETLKPQSRFAKNGVKKI